jgi:small subunit ribosomal protein S10
MTKIVIKSCCSYTLQTYVAFLKLVFKNLNLASSVFFLPTSEKKLTLLKSPHVNKKAKEQFQVSIYKVVISVETSPILKNYFSFFILNKPKVVTIKIKF